jgi:hypothetical protein
MAKGQQLDAEGAEGAEGAEDTQRRRGVLNGDRDCGRHEPGRTVFLGTAARDAVRCILSGCS